MKVMKQPVFNYQADQKNKKKNVNQFNKKTSWLKPDNWSILKAK